jgi:hypothetical protein
MKINEDFSLMTDKYRLRRFLESLNLDDSEGLEKESGLIIKNIRNIASIKDDYLTDALKLDYEKTIKKLEEAIIEKDFHGKFADTIDDLIYVLYGLKKQEK